MSVAHSNQTADGFLDLQLFLQSLLGLGLDVTELFLHFIDSDLSVDLVEGVHDAGEYQVDEEEGAEDHYQQEVDRRPVVAPRILHLLKSVKISCHAAYIVHVENPALKGQGLKDSREGEHDVVERPHSIHDDLVLVNQAVRAIELRLVQLVAVRGVPAECPHRALIPGPRVF